MSLILEALRKSEAERRRAQAPDLFAEPQLALPRPQAAWPRWAWFALAGLGLVALLVLVRALWPSPAPVAGTEPRPHRSSTRSPVMPEAEAPSTATVATAIPPTSQPRPPVQALPETPAPRAEQTPPHAPVVVAAAPPPLEQPRLSPEPAVQPPAPVPERAAVPAQTAVAESGTLRLSDLGTEERQQLPTLKLSMHMWDDTPAQRFVILDGQRLGEGDRIGGAVVEQITRDGAILDWNGRRLRVSMR